MKIPTDRRWHWGEPVERLRQLLRAGGVLAIPTESSYGLAVDPCSVTGVEAIYALKGRDAGKPLPVVAADVEQVVALGIDRNLPALEVAAAAWPAPLSVLFPVAEPPAAAAGGATLAVRVPAHSRLCQLLKVVGFALTATSANRSGDDPILDPTALDSLLMDRPAVLVDDGVLPGGPPSTLVDWRDGNLRILRPGAYRTDLLPQTLPELTPFEDRVSEDTLPKITVQGTPGPGHETAP